MNWVEELIERMCPDGVEYKTLGEIGKFYGGLSGKTKEDFGGAGSHFITYMNVYSNLSVNTNITDTVRLTANEKQNVVQYGDVLFTGSSETKDECGISSVMTYHIAEPLYLNSFCFGFRLDNLQILNPEFAKYLFRSESIRKQIIKTASGVTRFNVSKKKMGQVSIPLPPLEVQNEIVNILDNFSKLEAELEAELEARKQQYEYYRDTLLSFNLDVINSQHVKDLILKYCPNGVEYKKLGLIVAVNRGVRVVKKDLASDGPYPVYQNCLIPLGYHTEKNCPSNTTYVISAGAAGEIGYSSIDFWAADDCFYFLTNGRLNSKYLYYVLLSKQNNIKTKVHKASIPRLPRKVLEDLEIPLPPLEVQNEIVSILDRFDKLCNDLTEGLPAEIEARRKQYEYYRDLLLTFKPKEKECST